MNKRISGIHGVLLRSSDFLREIWRRRLVQAAAAYAVVGWIIIEIASVILPAFDAPQSVLQTIIGVILLGFPIVMVFSWIFDMTAEGLVRTDDADEDVEEDLDELEIRSVRRQLTVLCAAIGISQDGDSVDPEDLMEIQPGALQLCRKVCERFDGCVVSGRSGELLVYFGYPVAQEDATRNAIRAALGMVVGVSRFSEGGSSTTNVSLSCCAAVHTGDVIVELSSNTNNDEPTIVGILPSEAAHLLKQCAPGEVLITAEANRQVKGLFEVALTETAAGDSGNATKASYRVGFESGVRNRLDAQGDEELLPLIGRDIELSQLQQHWRRTLDGNGQVILMTGVAGIGKSRIVRGFKEVVAENPQAWMWELFCEPMSQDTALHPVAEFFHRAVLGLNETESPAESLVQVEGYLAEYNQNLADTVPLFAAMLNVPLSDQYQVPNYSPQRQRQAILQLIVDILVMRASRQPSLLIMEDLHWADSTSLELLTLLIEQVPAQRIMCVLTFRSPFEPPWKFASHIFPVNIAGLESTAAEAVCRSVSAAIPTHVVAQITARADGVPLFIEEVTRSLVESGAFGDEPDEQQLQHIIESLIPATLKDALTARLDRLGKARNIAQLGAAIGRDFSHSLIAEVANEVKARQIDAGLQKLIEPEIILKMGSGERASYRFKHALIHDAAYQSMIKKQRQLFHTAVAAVLERKFPDLVTINPEILAHHYAYAGIPKKSIEYRLKAAAQAMLAAATAEAISHLQNGLRLLDGLKEGPDRNLLELSLQTMLGSASMFAFGYASKQAHEAYSQAEALCGPDVPLQHSLPVVMGLSAYHSVRGAATEGQRQNQRILKMAEMSQDDDLLLWGHAFACVGNFYEGKFAQSRSHLEHVIRLYDIDRHRGISAATSQDPKVFAMLHAAQATWALGYPDQARELALQKDELAAELGHPLVLQQALGWGNIVYLYRHEPEILVEKARKAHGIATEQNIPFYIGGNLVWWGAGLSRQGNHESGVQMMREGLQILQSTGAQIGRPLMLTLVAQSLSALQRPDEGVAEIVAALAQVDEWGERFYLSETYRVSGDLKLLMGDQTDAENDYREAIRVAREQNAKSWELRATTSLASLLQAQDRESEVADTVADLCKWFEEGRSTGDIKHARAILAASG